MSEIKQRKGSKKSNISPKDINKEKTNETKKSPSLRTRIILFLIFPSFMGCFGLFTAYLINVKTANKVEDKAVNFDRDFINPFILALAISGVVWYQTNGFTYTKPKPLVSWPKVKRKRRVIRTEKIIDSDDDDDEEEEELAKENMTKKDN